MDILAKKRMLFPLILWIAGVFLGVDYFGMRAAAREKDSLFPAQELWSEIRVMPGGGVEIYRPPQPVVDFLESPSEETGKRYLQWNALRMEKIWQGQKGLERLPV